MDGSLLVLKAFWTIVTCAAFLNVRSQPFDLSAWLGWTYWEPMLQQHSSPGYWDTQAAPPRQGCSGIKGDEVRLIGDLLKDYNTNARPVKNGSDIINLELRLSYEQLQNMDEPKQVMASLVGFRFKWKDAFLQWNSSDYGDYSIIRLHPSLIWKPDLTLHNNAHEDGGELYNFNTLITITSDGTVSWYAPAILKSVCIIDVSKFPFDQQHCSLKIGSWNYDASTLTLSVHDNKTAPLIYHYKENSEWTLVSATAITNTVLYKCCAVPYQDITFTFHLKRKPLYYIMTIIFPCITLSLLATISFLFPAESGERISLVISVILSLVVFMIIVNDQTPATSDSIPMITQYFSSITFMTLLALLATAFILRMNHASSSTPVPHYLATIRDFFAVVLCMKKEVYSKPTQFDFGEALLIDATKLLNLRDLVVPGQTRKRLTEGKILKELQNLSKRMEDDDLAKEGKEDWHYTARVFDMLFFYSFLLVFLSLPVYVLSFL